MYDEYLKARKAGEKEYKARTAAGEYPFLPALDDILPQQEVLTHRPLGLMEIPVEMIAGTMTRARQNAFAANFMPLLEPDSEFGAKWSSLYNAQMEEGINDPIKAYEYLHRFYVQEGNKRVSVCRFFEMPVISADVIRIMPSEDTLREHPEYEEFLRFYNVAPIYDIDISWAGAYTEIAELLGMDLDRPWPEDVVRALRNAYWVFSMAYRDLGSKVPPLKEGDAFMVYLRIYIKDALRQQSAAIVEKRLTKIKKELLIEYNTDRVALIESSEEALDTGSLITKTGSAVSKMISTLSYGPNFPLKAAFIYDKQIADSARVADHDTGRRWLEKVYNGTVATEYFVAPGGTGSFEKAVDSAAAWGADVIFTTSPSQMNDTLRASIEYEDIKFLNCSVNLAHQSVRTYYAKLYEAKFLAGIVAGAASAADGTHKIGYCSDYPIYGTVAGINAFAAGAAMMDPSVEIHLDWATRRDANWWWNMVGRGIHVISSVDSMHNSDGSSAYGLCYVELCKPGEGNDLSGKCFIKNLASPLVIWGKLYESIVKTVIEGTYYSHAVDKKDRATNYWWGMMSGVVDIVLSEEIPEPTRHLVDVLRRDIIDGRFSPFEGELVSQDGPVKHASDVPLTSREIIMMDWLDEHIIGEIPTIDALKDEAKATVKLSGLEKTKKGKE